MIRSILMIALAVAAAGAALVGTAQAAPGACATSTEVPDATICLDGDVDSVRATATVDFATTPAEAIPPGQGCRVVFGVADVRGTYYDWLDVQKLDCGEAFANGTAITVEAAEQVAGRGCAPGADYIASVDVRSVENPPDGRETRIAPITRVELDVC